ncbi:L-aspartate oxidase [Coriobacteriaceae bacterium CHKCI002]|nr:L-aspartate oxidase [Coriobacteriaceae bacterium CHKCI002]
MEFETTRTFDVLVVGGGIAGTTAALHAARSGARTAIACAGALFSGSSFYPGTWGLGLVGPESSDDEDDLVRAILEVGCGAALPKLVSVFVRDIPSAIDELEAAGVRLMRPDRPDEREFVPCFDRKHRLWRGIVRESYEEAVRRELERLGVEVLPGRTLVDLVERDGAVAGAVLAAHGKAAFEPVDSKATVLATGGFGGLFERRLTANDVTGSAHAVALAHGCALVNLEFMQMMPGLVSPKRGIVFNEKTFRHVALRNPDGTDPFAGRSDAQALLEERSGHGPFTARLASRAIDLAMDAAGPKGLAVRYRIGDAEDGAESAALPEFVRTYFDWLEEAAGIQPTDELRIAPYAHAANGGILIDADGSCGVPGLFACGEATGGMHGADRIGGLSSANGLVFGRRAGRSAAAWSKERAEVRRGGDALSADVPRHALPNAPEIARLLRRTMTESCMIVRTEDGLERALATIDELAERARAEVRPASDATAIAEAAIVRNQLMLAKAFAEAALARTESRGAHFRADFPAEDPAQARPLLVELDAQGAPRTRPLAPDARNAPAGLEPASGARR